MKLFRKTLILVSMSLILLLSACSKDDKVVDSGKEVEIDDTGINDEIEENDDDQINDEAVTDDKDDETVTSDDEGEPTLADLAAKPLNELTAIDMARVMGNGINLTNTMEACSVADRIPNRDPSVYEVMWGQPITTPEMIEGMRASGFKSLRIPVAWTNAMDFENGDFTIGEPLFARVEEIINYALDADMFVMINDHWDHGWWSMFGNPDQEVRDKAMEMYISMWTQIADRYKDYDSRLIFESANEELGNRLNDETIFSPTGGTLTMDECYEMVTKINQTFIDVVRESGGNNAERFLLVKGYNTDIEMTMDERFVMPVDPANKLLLGVHYYNPWSYCGDTAGVSAWGTTAEVEEMHRLLGELTKFTDQGYGVILGEWGVLDNVGEDRYDYYVNFLNLSAKYGYVPFLWDGGNIYSRTENTITADNDDFIDNVIELYADFDVSARADMTVEDIVKNADEALAQAIIKAEEKSQFIYGDDESYAWIMFASSDWGVQYSVGDTYEPNSKATGLITTDVQITGPGTYTVALDMTGTDAGFANGIAFSAVGLVNAETLWPGYIMELKEVLINGEEAEVSGKPYTASDDGNTTRVNLYNSWVGGLPDDARTADGDLSDATAIPFDGYIDTQIESIVVTFDYYEATN